MDNTVNPNPGIGLIAATCNSCKRPYGLLDMAKINSCQHICCKYCLIPSIVRQLESGKEATCPGEKGSCQSPISDWEVQAILPYETYQKVQASLMVRLQTNKDLFVCKNQLCRCSFEVQSDSTLIYCPSCQAINCVPCQKIHADETCPLIKLTLNNSISGASEPKKRREMDVNDVENSLAPSPEVDNPTVSNVPTPIELQSVLDSSAGKERQESVSTPDTEDVPLYDVVDEQSYKGYSLRQRKQAVERNASPIPPKLADTISLLENEDTFKCPICMVDVKPKKGIILPGCLHTFCKRCLIKLVEHSDAPVLKCPYMDGNYSCVCRLPLKAVKTLVPPEKFEKYVERVLRLGESSIEEPFHCATAKCRGWCVNDEKEARFECPSCLKITCMKCKAIHEPFTCEQHEEMSKPDYAEKEIEKLIKKGVYMKCPTCTVLIEKAGGCDWVKCDNCKTEICWATKGPRWGPKGHGDISGGCRCQVNGVKCHPLCNCCH